MDDAAALLDSVVHHAALPPKAPQQQECELGVVESRIGRQLLDACRKIRDLVSSHQSQYGLWDDVRLSLQNSLSVTFDGQIDKARLSLELQQLQDSRFLILHVTEQNAGLFIYNSKRCDGDHVVFEAFEASAESEQVQESRSALVRRFPGCAVEIPRSVFDQTAFQDQLAEDIERLSTESVKQFTATSRKDGSGTHEGRETTNPEAVTGWLMSMLEGFGRAIVVRPLEKRMYDDVNWHKAEFPWRRSPFLVVLKVGLQRAFLHADADQGHVNYKYLILVFLAQLLDSLTLVSELSVFLRTKIGYRKTKLDLQRHTCNIPKIRDLFSIYTEVVDPFLSHVMTAAERHIANSDDAFKEATAAVTSDLLHTAHSNDLKLNLHVSGPYITNALMNAPVRRPYGMTDLAHAVDIDKYNFITSYRELANQEITLTAPVADQEFGEEADAVIQRTSDQLGSYISAVGQAYEENPALMSSFLLLVLETWIRTDKAATSQYPLLHNYPPPFEARMLDVLRPESFVDMQRLKQVHLYLDKRWNACRPRQKSIFSLHSEGFAARYFDTDERMKTALQQITADATTTRADRKEEWERKSAEWQKLNDEYNTKSHWNFVTGEYVSAHWEDHPRHRCPKCKIYRRMKKITIRVFEWPLVSETHLHKATVFELTAPPSLLRYRDITARVLRRFGYRQSGTPQVCHTTVREYSGLQRYVDGASSSLTLGTTTKSEYQTHRAEVGFRVKFNKVCPEKNHMSLAYVVQGTQGVDHWWMPDLEKRPPSLMHLFSDAFLQGTPFECLSKLPGFSVGGKGPTSNEIIATQVSCPPKTGQREFMAFQMLYSGFERRWPQILLALGSSDLNFSSEPIVHLISRLVTQAGPAAGSNPLRVVHVPLQEPSFRHSLCAHLHARLDTLEANWREIIAMRMIVTIALRLCAVSNARGDIADGISLLNRARYMLQSWVQELRTMHSASHDRDKTVQYSKYASEAALLCKKTYVVFTYPLLQNQDTLTVQEVQCFVESSITVYKYIIEAPKDVPLRIRNDLAADAQLGYRLEPIIYHSLQTRPTAIQRALVRLWPGILPEGETRQWPAHFMSAPFQDWLHMRVSQKNVLVELSYHVITGCALINGRPQSALPDDLSQSPILKEMFGRQNFETTPSRLPEMTYHLRIGSPGYEVHLGFRESDLIVRLVTPDKVLECIPRDVFGPSDKRDLPTPLVVDCVHWLNVCSGQIEIRHKARMFEEDENNWILELDGFCGRPTARRKDGSMLVEKGTPSHTRICHVLSKFEPQNQLVVLQRQDGTLAVELPRCELTFFVNGKALLECEQLHGELKPKQECGAWYGLMSKLVLRDIVNPDLETVIVPLGPVYWKRLNTHVTVTVDGRGPYGKFAINKENHRIDAPPEPRLLYTKALLHALTSLSTKDHLTGMTGTESALRCLGSSVAKPYAPLTTGADFALPILAKLTPHREFYPKGKRVQQETRWDEHLPFWTQHEAFRPLVERIRARSNELVDFTPGSAVLPDLLPQVDDAHLPERSLLRRARYETNPGYHVEQPRQDLVYKPRDASGQHRKRTNVFQCASLFASWTTGFHTTQELSSIMQSWAVIAGFEGQVAPAAFSDRFGLRLAEAFGSLVRLCREAGTGDRWRLAFMLSPFCYRHDVEMDIIRTLIAVAICDELKELEPPKWPLFDRFVQGVRPGKDHLLEVIQPYVQPFAPSIQTTPGITLSKRQRRRLETESNDYDRLVREELDEMAEFVLGRGSGEDIGRNEWPPCSYIETDRALSAAVSEWKRLTANYELSTYVQRLQALLNGRDGNNKRPLPRPKNPTQTQVVPWRRPSDTVRLTLSDILRMPKVTRPPSLWSNERSVDDLNALTRKAMISGENDSPKVRELNTLIRALKGSKSEVRSTYANDLEKSLEALRLSGIREAAPETGGQPTISDNEIQFAENQVLQLWTWIETELQARHPASKWLTIAGLWPATNPSILLSELRSQISSDLGPDEKRLLIELGLRINALQRLKRIRDAERRGATIRAHGERQNTGHTNWSPAKYPDWLLIEVDSNVTIREEQVDVARATIDPPSADNSCLQLNMGGGKSSVILPMCASVLANKEQLVRLVVPRALLLQTAQVLQSKLGGLLDREVRHVPFSRRAPQDVDSIKKYRRLHIEVLVSGGVMLCLPEHMLSFKLSGQQRLADENLESGTLMVRTQEWLDTMTRDVIDECDEILSNKCQLVYPSGLQLAVDGHPYRWEVIQELLDAAAWHADRLSKQFSDTFEVFRRNDALYPVIFFLNPSAEEALNIALVQDICAGRLRALPLQEMSENCVQSVRQYLMRTQIDRDLSHKIGFFFRDKPTLKNTIYLVRGLITYGILVMSLKRRWNVQYGLHPSRDPISVPYHAKGNPSDHAEWGHPDVSLLFTTLSFYYGGLTVAQLKQALDHLLQSDDPASEYEVWLDYTGNPPNSLRDWSHVNTGDTLQLATLHDLLSHCKPTIKYFINRFVFPVHAKQFAVKLQASGWDLPHFSPQQIGNADSKLSNRPRTTGFSGTNDQRNVLPLTIKQNDLSALLQTNADVLATLLEPRNREYIQMQENGRRLSEFGILRLLKSKNVPVMIDAGAAIVSATNQELVIAWLKIWPTAPAAVYFDQKGRAIVRHHKGHETPLVNSPYADDLSSLLVFVDHQHVRGTDLKFPPKAKGAVTLALGQTKDHSIQSCMRLRQLQTTQSICWLAPPEVHLSIVDAMAPERSGKLDSYDVVWWLLEQSCRSIEQSLPLFTVQGETFCEQLQAQVMYPNFLKDKAHRKQLLSKLHQVECQSLEDLYDPFTQQKAAQKQTRYSGALIPFIEKLWECRKVIQDKGVLHSGALEEVEQEREVTAEAEVVRELQKPGDFQAIKPNHLHEDIKELIRTGRIDHSCHAWVDVFTAMSRTKVGSNNGVRSASNQVPLYVSKEYLRTIKTKHVQFMDNFIRPASWLLLVPVLQQGLLISPEEAELMLPLLRRAKVSKVNLTLYSAPVTRKMRVFEELKLYSVPALPTEWAASPFLKVLLGVFAGFLYFDHGVFGHLRRFLDDSKAADKDADSPLAKEDILIARPLPFFKSWLDVRTKGQEYYETPAGYVSQGKDIPADHRFFRQQERDRVVIP